MNFLLTAYAVIWVFFIAYFAAVMMKTSGLRARIKELSSQAQRPAPGGAR